MHRLILSNAILVDHKNFDGLDNRRTNLREATAQQSIAHRRKCKNAASQYIGVSRIRGKKWRAQVQINGLCVFSEQFDSEEAAARAHDAAAVKYFGEFASLNFPAPTQPVPEHTTPGPVQMPSRKTEEVA
jgi:AP2 domain